MAYRPTNFGPVRDKTYPSEIAAQRPALATRIQCEETREDDAPDHGMLEAEYSPSRTIRGDRSDDRCAKFNEQLRGGHAGRNDGEE